MSDPLTAAIIAAGEELHRVNHWTVRDDGEFGAPEEYSAFVETLLKHISPLFDGTTFKQARIKALEAELAALRGDSP